MANWFVGISIPTEGWFSKLVEDAPRHVRVFQPEDVHMTVAFLGAAGEEKARAAWALAERYQGAPFEVELGRLAPMGNPRRPSALSLLLEDGDEEAVALVRALRDPMIEAAGARPDTRPPKAHITVARPGRKVTSRQRREAVEWAESKPAVGAKVPVDRLVLYTWSEDRPRRQFREVVARNLGRG